MLDKRGAEETYTFDDNSVHLIYLTHKQPEFDFAKQGDVGLDLPIIIEGSAVIDPILDEITPEMSMNDIVQRASTHQDKIFPSEGKIVVPPHCFVIAATGMRVKVPEGCWGNVKTRSSTALKKGLLVADTVIDSQYTGPLLSFAYNPHNKDATIFEGDRIAQLILVPRYDINDVVVVNNFPVTERGQTGWGSTG